MAASLCVVALVSGAQTPTEGPSLPSKTTAQKPVVRSIKPEDLVEYSKMPSKIQKLIRGALELTTQKLGYKYGSNSPVNKGMDCSGTVQRALISAGVKGVPRSSYTMYHWAKQAGKLNVVSGVHSFGHQSLENLKPGDLLFWEGTYATKDRVPPISHVMIYLGTLKSDGKPVIFGASSGRRYRGTKIHGVSVFDFSLPKPDSKARFTGFGPVPGL